MILGEAALPEHQVVECNWEVLLIRKHEALVQGQPYFRILHMRERFDPERIDELVPRDRTVRLEDALKMTSVLQREEVPSPSRALNRVHGNVSECSKNECC